LYLDKNERPGVLDAGSMDFFIRTGKRTMKVRV
jgi:hypothetical protein